MNVDEVVHLYRINVIVYIEYVVQTCINKSNIILSKEQLQ